MSEAEDKFHAVLVQILKDVKRNTKFITYEDFASAIMGSLKLDNWMLIGDAIHELTDWSMEDVYENTVYWWVWSKSEIEEDDE